MSNLTKGVAVIAVILAIGAGLVFWKARVGGHHGDESLNRLTKEDMSVLLADANPMQLQQISSNPEAKKKIAENIRQLLAVASQARKEGLANDETVKRELESTRSIVTASLYDKHINEGKGQMPPFSFITEEQVKQFWGEAPGAEPSGVQGFLQKIGLGDDKARREMEFQQFLDTKIALAKETGRFPEDKTLTEDELKQAKDDYAKIKIYEAEANAKQKELGDEFNRNLELQIKLQQAQFLASRYATKNLVERVKVTDEDIKQYVAAHPEFSTEEKRTAAQQILSRARAGEDFAKLADELSDDPGTKGKGGLYENVTPGKMVPAFEQAALALEPGQITENLVETPYGYHIIKLEKRGTAAPDPSSGGGEPAETYDVRHILVTTTMKDPNNPMGREMPINDMVRSKLEEEKQKRVLDEIVANNPVEVPEDFEIPKPSEEDMKQMQQQMMQQQMPMQMPEAMEDEEPQPKPAPKKK